MLPEGTADAAEERPKGGKKRALQGTCSEAAGPSCGASVLLALLSGWSSLGLGCLVLSK